MNSFGREPLAARVGSSFNTKGPLTGGGLLKKSWLGPHGENQKKNKRPKRKLQFIQRRRFSKQKKETFTRRRRQPAGDGGIRAASVIRDHERFFIEGAPSGRARKWDFSTREKASKKQGVQ